VEGQRQGDNFVRLAPAPPFEDWQSLAASTWQQPAAGNERTPEQEAWLKRHDGVNCVPHFKPEGRINMKPRVALLVLLLSLLSSAKAEERKHIVIDPTNPLPFSNGVLVGDTLYIAGHIGVDPKTGKVPANVEDEARLVMEAIKKTVEEAGMAMDDIVSIQVHCPDLTLYDTFNKVYRTYFHAPYPARAFLGSGTLLRDGHFEVLGIAVRPKK
jgi:2-iminobutanoate/2-iminopropanoate deaminase